MSKEPIPYKIFLEEDEMPRAWMNLGAIVPKLPPMLDPETMQPITKEAMKQVFCDEAVEQELNTTDKFIPIPQEVWEFYRMLRPSPVGRAYNLERPLDTPP